jgi:hypothetical protein
MFPSPPAIPIHNDRYVSGEIPEIDVTHPETGLLVVFLLLPLLSRSWFHDYHNQLQDTTGV